MKKEGWKFVVALVSITLMFVVGIVLVRPFPWLEAQELKLEGEIIVDGASYSFLGDDALVIDNIRQIKGVASNSTGGKIFFNAQGAEVKVDQLGYLYGDMVLDGYGLIELGTDYDREVLIDQMGNMSGKFKVDGMSIEFVGETKWRPYELAEIQVASTMKVDVGSKSMIDPTILGLGGRGLYDVQIVYKSNNDNVTVDEYGYVEVSREGTFRNAVIVSVGDEKKAITLQAVERVTDVTVSPNVVVKDTDPILTISVDPASQVEGVIGVALVKGSDDRVLCSLIDKDTGAGTVSANCNLAGNAVGGWNVVLQMGSFEEYVFLSKLNILDDENPLNLTLVTDVYELNNEGTGYVDKDSMTVKSGDQIKYYVLVDLPSFLEDTDINGGEFFVDFVGRGPSPSRCVLYSGDVTPGVLRGTFAPDADGRLDLGDVVYTGNMPQGCDLVANLSLNNVQFDNGLTGIGGTAEASNGIKSAKQVLLRGDVLVQEGNLEVEQLHDSANMFTLVAGDDVDTNITGEGNVSDYGLSTDAQFEQVLSQIQDNIQKLVIERAQSNQDLIDIEEELKTFYSSEKAKNPEGRIIYNGSAGIGPVILGSGLAVDENIEVCGPVTLVVEGRDVEITRDIVKANVDGFNCVDEGNFGLIVIDGDIKFAGGDIDHLPSEPGPVENVMGYYFTTGTMYTGESHAKFTLSGVSIAHDYVLQRY